MITTDTTLTVTKRPLADLIASRLLALGIHDLFAIPGDFVLPWLSRFEQQSSLTLVQLSHEPSAVFAADAAARYTNKPAAVVLTYGAGALNAINAVAQAYMEFVPLLVFAGFPSARELDAGYLLHHQTADVDGQLRMLSEVTALQVRLDNPATAVAQFELALATCQRESRPVLIELPRDMAMCGVPEISSVVHQATTCTDKTNQIQRLDEARCAITSYLQKASKPCALVGAKARRFGFADAVMALSRRCQLTCVTTLLGRGVVSKSQCLFGGTFTGAKGDPLADFLLTSDLLLLCGVIHSDSNFAGYPTLLSDRPVLWWDEHGVRLPDGRFFPLTVADSTELFATINLPFTPRLGELAPSCAPAESPKAWSSGLVMQQLHKQLTLRSELYPFVVDIGDCLFASLQVAPEYLLAPAFYASMGYAVPAALGLQQVSKLRPIVVVGDGAFQMTGLELGHCSRFGWTPIVIVLNNQSWGMIKAFAPDLQATSLSGWNYAALARAMNGGSRQVWNVEQFVSAIDDALADTQRFRLIEVMLPADSYSECLARFSGAMTTA
ncbi:MAG TPA: indolepyruvate decarboxylase [Rheinheimera sp.]|nr:indolepyruvate decarboxylase [Rheinheimera sp.]